MVRAWKSKLTAGVVLFGLLFVIWQFMTAFSKATASSTGVHVYRELSANLKADPQTLNSWHNVASAASELAHLKVATITESLIIVNLAFVILFGVSTSLFTWRTCRARPEDAAVTPVPSPPPAPLPRDPAP